MDTEPPGRQPQPNTNPPPPQSPGPNGPKKSDPQSIYPTPTAPSFFTPSPGLSKSTLKNGNVPPQAPVVTQPSQAPRKSHKGAGIILAIIFIFSLGVGTGIMIHANLPTDLPSTDEAQLSADQSVETNDKKSESPADDLDSWARDSHRKADIDSTHTDLEVYYVDNGYYPPESVFHDEASAVATFPELNVDNLKDPQGRFINSSSSDYRYTAQNCSDQCDTYELVTRLEGGEGSYSNNSLN